MKMDCDLDDFAVHAPDPEVVLKFLSEMEFRTMSARIARKAGRMDQIFAATFGGRDR